MTLHNPEGWTELVRDLDTLTKYGNEPHVGRHFAKAVRRLLAGEGLIVPPDPEVLPERPIRSAREVGLDAR